MRPFMFFVAAIVVLLLTMLPIPDGLRFALGVFFLSVLCGFGFAFGAMGLCRLLGWMPCSIVIVPGDNTTIKTNLNKWREAK